MNWVDVAGAPGSGKSALCDPICPPHCVAPEEHLPPVEWEAFCDEITRLFGVIREHRSFKDAVRMNRRSVRKIATVYRMQSQPGSLPYIQTGLVQRGLGFGWRLADMKKDVSELRRYFELMPVSIGVAVCQASKETIVERNRERAERARREGIRDENRDYMVPLMEKAGEVAIDVLTERSVPIIAIDTESQPADDARNQLLDFAATGVAHASTAGPRGQMEVFPPPPWW